MLNEISGKNVLETMDTSLELASFSNKCPTLFVDDNETLDLLEKKV